MSDKTALRVLFLGGARRVAFARKLIAAARQRRVELKLFSYELRADVAISSVAEIIIGGKFTDPDALDRLAEVVENRHIDIVIPFVDPAVVLAARLQQKLSRVYIPVSSPSASAITFDKIKADRFFQSAGLPVPERVSTIDTVLYPLIFKPRCGSASKGIIVARSREKAAGLGDDWSERYIAQRYIANRCELTVDCFISRAGKVLACVPRRRLEVIGGEAVKTVTVYSPAAVNLATEVIEALELRGAVTVQLIADCDDVPLKWLVMEVNPRLGGGVVASINAGADIPGLIIDEALGRELQSQSYSANTLTVRYLADVVVDFNPPQ